MTENASSMKEKRRPLASGSLTISRIVQYYETMRKTILSSAIYNGANLTLRILGKKYYLLHILMPLDDYVLPKHVFGEIIEPGYDNVKSTFIALTYIAVNEIDETVYVL